MRESDTDTDTGRRESEAFSRAAGSKLLAWRTSPPLSQDAERVRSGNRDPESARSFNVRVIYSTVVYILLAPVATIATDPW